MPKLRLYCSAHSKRSGKPCRNQVLPGEKVCRMHGRDGGAPIQHGRFSNLPDRLRAAKLAAANDPRLLDLADGVELLDALLQSRMGMLSGGDSAGWRRDLRAKLQEWREEPDDGLRSRLHSELEELIEEGARAGQAEDEVFDMRERVSARVEELHRIRLAKGSVINARDAAKLLVMDLHEYKRLMDIEGIPLPVQRRIVEGLIGSAVRRDDAPPEFRAELSVAALEVAGGRV